MLLVWTVFAVADEADFAGTEVPLTDVVDFLAVDEAGFLAEDAMPAVDFVPADVFAVVFAVEWAVLVDVVFLAVSAVAATANTAQAPHQATNNDAIRIRFIGSIGGFNLDLYRQASA